MRIITNDLTKDQALERKDAARDARGFKDSTRVARSNALPLPVHDASHKRFVQVRINKSIGT